MIKTCVNFLLKQGVISVFGKLISNFSDQVLIYVHRHVNSCSTLYVTYMYVHCIVHCIFDKVTVVCGSTGESLSLTVVERKMVAEEWMKASEGRLAHMYMYMHMNMHSIILCT